MVLEFEKKVENPVIIFGGSPFLEDINHYPNCPETGEPMVLLFTVLPGLITGIPDNKCISVFASFGVDKYGVPKRSLSNKYTVHSKADLELLEKGYSKVIIHEKATEPLVLENAIKLPLMYAKKRRYTNEELDEEIKLQEETGMGLDCSKIMGTPFFEQDNIDLHMPRKYFFTVQLNEWDISDVDKGLKGIFQDGLGYLFLEYNHERAKDYDEVGKFFIQHT